MCWKRLCDVPKQVKFHRGARLTLVQVNYIADLVEKFDSWMFAWSSFEKKFHIEDSKWVPN